ncbi:CCND2 [Lepeophtheirus salmonis]|nr:CCND2 [Lepeophtheirus salmonis]CAF2941948.1 CCND2 [Lepeophtheirus salmonis]
MCRGDELFAMEGELALTNVDNLVLTEAKSYEDPVLISDVRILSNILLREKDAQKSPKENYFECVQTEVKPHMRKIVTDWMLEVCEDQKCQAEVFSLAVNYLDGFLAKINIQKSQFQLLATVCIFVASKFKETAPVPAENLVIYTDNSVSILEITQWELILLNVLEWDLSAVTPYGILDHLLRTLNIESSSSETIRRHAETFVALTATEFVFYQHGPAAVAVSCLGAALRGLNVSTLSSVLEHLHYTTGVNTITIKDCMDQIEESISMSMSGLSFQPSSSSPAAPSSKSNNVSAPKIIPQHYNGSKFVSTTPTDVMDVACAF